MLAHVMPQKRYRARRTRPHDLAACRDETELADVDLDDSTLGQDTERGVQRRLGVLLYAQDWQLERRLELG